MERYRHTQTGHLILAAVGLGLLAISLLLFTFLTVAIHEEAVEVRFGPVGLVKKGFLLRDIESCQAVRDRWWYSWGIRLTPCGWLFNVSGLDAVELRMGNGKIYRIGTDQPQALEQAIRQFTS